MRRRLKARSTGADVSAAPKDARLAAVALLARRDFASGELAERLLEQGFAPEAVSEAIAGLTGERLLDDLRFATAYVASHAQRGQGPRRIAMELASRGLAPPLIQAAVTAGADWAARAREVRNRRFGPTLPESWAEKAKQGRFLQYRGFSSDHIRSALGPDFESEDPS